MMRSTTRDQANHRGWGVVMGATFLSGAMAIGLMVAPLSAQESGIPTGAGLAKKYGLPAPLPPLDNGARPTATDIPIEFLGTWRGNNPRGSTEFGGNCGSLKDHYGNPRELCEFPVDKLEPHMNGRMRAWIEFFDEPLSPRWECLAAGLQTGLQEGYLWEFSTRPDALLQRWEQSNWVRTIWMDGR